MQRCPYIHEMKERLLGNELVAKEPVKVQLQQHQHLVMDSNKEVLEIIQDPAVGTIVKLNSDGYGSHTSPAHSHQCTPLIHDASTDGGCPPGPCLATTCCQCQENHHGPKNAKTSLFIIMSFIYAKLLVVICIAYVISDVITHSLPLYYYEGFFTYLYGMSILFLLYVFCFLLQESTCCSGSGTPPKPKPPPPEKKPKEKKEKEKKNKEKEKESKKDGKNKDKDKDKDKENKDKENKEKEKEKDKDAGKEKETKAKDAKKQSHFQEVYPRKMRDIVREQQLRTAPLCVPEQDVVEVEAQIPPRSNRRRKTTQNDHSHGSFFLRIGAIAFGLGTMIYTGLEFGTFFEIPFTSPCHQILRGVNPVLQMIFTFMQMYFIFMNSRLNIHRFKVIARFGLMHVIATNICVWIRTLVLESLKEITSYHLKRGDQPEDGIILESIRQHSLRNSGTVLGVEAGGTRALPIATTPSTTTTTLKEYAYRAFAFTTSTAASTTPDITTTTKLPYHYFQSKTPSSTLVKKIKSTITTTPDPWYNAQPDINDPWANDDPWTTPPTNPPTTTLAPLTTVTTQIATAATTAFQWVYNTFAPVTSVTTTQSPPPTPEAKDPWGFSSNNNFFEADNSVQPSAGESQWNSTAPENIDNLFPSAFISLYSNNSYGASQNCNRINIMGTIVQDSAPYLYPFIIEYSLIGAAVIYIMWKHIGRYSRYISDEDLEHRLEVMLSRRAVAMAHAQQTGRMDCVGASKGLFFGLLLLVGSLICLILFFVLVHHPQLGLLAIYLADVSHCVLMILSIFAIIIGFIRVRHLKFRSEDQSDLNDILLRISAFGLFVYAVFSVIAGSLGAFTKEPNLLVMITGILSVAQVVLQLLFIADVSRRRVHLPEQDRTKPARQVVTFLLICNVTMWLIYTFETQKVVANPVQLDFYGFLAWALVQRITLPLCIFHRFHSAVTLAEIWKTSYKARLE